jgi:hypothetical protein
MGAGNGLERFDADYRAPTHVSSATPAAETVVYNGIYTLKVPGGCHKTFRIATKPLKSKFAPGQRIIALLTGPDNEQSYQPFGFVDDGGIRVWSRFRGTNAVPTQHDHWARYVWELANGRDVIGYSLLVSRRCIVCNRTLTTPESIETGVGPSCKKKLEAIKASWGR